MPDYRRAHVSGGTYFFTVNTYRCQTFLTDAHEGLFYSDPDFPSDFPRISDDTTANAGKYISDNVFLEVQQGVTSGSAKAKLEIELTPSLSAATRIGQQGQTDPASTGLTTIEGYGQQGRETPRLREWGDIEDQAASDLRVAPSMTC
jgi:hypothetical protein